MPTLQVFVSDETLARLVLFGAERNFTAERLAEDAIEEAANSAFRGQKAGPIYRRAIELAKDYIKGLAPPGALDSEIGDRATELVNNGKYLSFIEAARAEVEAERKRAAKSLGLTS